MKKIALLTIALCAISFAQWTQTSCWWYDSITGIPALQSGAGARAQAWIDGTPVNRSCNKDTFKMFMTDSLSLAQWLNLTANGNSGWWKVRKPGTYVANGLTATISSNYAVNVTFSGVDDLTYIVPVGGPAGVDLVIERWVAKKPVPYFPGVPPPLINDGDWCRAGTPAINNTWEMPDNEFLHNGISFSLWEKIQVATCNTAGEYHDLDGAWCTIDLQKVTTWIDPETGNFN